MAEVTCNCYEPGEDDVCKHIVSKTDGSGDVTYFCGKYSGGKPYGFVVRYTCRGTSELAAIIRDSIKFKERLLMEEDSK